MFRVIGTVGSNPTLSDLIHRRAVGVAFMRPDLPTGLINQAPTVEGEIEEESHPLRQWEKDKALNVSIEELIQQIYEYLSFHQTTFSTDLLRPHVRHLMGRLRPGGRSWRLPGHPGTIRDTVTIRGPGDARRPQHRRYPVDRPRLWKGGPARASIPVAQVAGGRSLVRGSAPACPALGGGGTLGAFANLPGIHDGRQGCRSAVRYRGGAYNGLRGARLDGVRRTQAEVALRYRYYRAYCGRPVGSVALPAGSLDKWYLLRSTPSGPLPAPAFFLWCSATDGLQSASGVDLRPYWEPARNDAHARESHSQHDFYLQTSSDRGVLLDLWLGIGRHTVGRGCSGCCGPRRAALATTAE